MTEHAAGGARPAHEPPPITRENDLSALQRTTVKKSVMGAMAGNAIEWFDYGIYGYLAVHLSHQIFGGSEEAILWTLFGFAVWGDVPGTATWAEVRPNSLNPVRATSPPRARAIAWNP